MKININLFPSEIKDTIKSYSFFKPKNKQELEDLVLEKNNGLLSGWKYRVFGKDYEKIKL